MITCANAARDRVLVVDDDPYIRRLLRTTLSNHGVEPLEARSGTEALEMARRMKPCLILLDVAMPPGIDGFETCTRLKSDPSTRDIAVIFMSSLQGGSDKLGGFRAGAVDYIPKPVHAGEVAARVETHLTIRRLQLELSRRNTELARRNAELEEADRRMQRDLEGARRVQRALLPASAPRAGDFRFAWRCEPSAAVGGDALDICAIDQRHVSFYVLDVTGHGVSAALLAVSVARLLTPRAGHTSLVVEHGRPAGGPRPVPPTGVMEQLNAVFPMDGDRNPHLITAIYGLLDSTDGTIRYACAGHPGPVIVRADGAVETMDGGSAPIGAWPATTYDELTLQLAPGDRLFLHTDGLYEQTNEAGEAFGRQRLRRKLAEPVADLGVLLEATVDAVRSWSPSSGLDDDLSIVAVARPEPRD